MVSASIFEDEIRQRREFYGRMGTPYTDRDLVTDVEEMAGEPEGMIAFDCGLTHNAREKGLKCDRIVDGENCAECRAHAEGKALDCGIGTAARRDGKTCAWDNRDDCAECRLAAEERKRDCGMAPEIRKSGGAECMGGEATDCAECRLAGVRRERDEFEVQIVAAERAAAAAVPDDVTALRARLDCGLSADDRESESCRLGSLDVCAECAIAAMGRRLDGAKDCERKAIEQRDAWQRTAEEAQREAARLRATLAEARATAPDRTAKAPTVAQEPLSLFASLVPGSAPQEPATVAPVPTVKPLRACGCGGRGPHRAGCSLRKVTP